MAPSEWSTSWSTKPGPATASSPWKELQADSVALDMASRRLRIEEVTVQKPGAKIVAFDPTLAAPEELYAFPVKAFELSGDKDELLLDVDRSKIQAMKKFDAERWANLNDRVWVADVDRYLVTVFGTATDTPAAVFTRLDDDRSGFLSEAEAKNNTGVHSAWKQLDKNNDAKISRSEFTGNYKMER